MANRLMIERRKGEREREREKRVELILLLLLLLLVCPQQRKGENVSFLIVLQLTSSLNLCSSKRPTTLMLIEKSIREKTYWSGTKMIDTKALNGFTIIGETQFIIDTWECCDISLSKDEKETVHVTELSSLSDHFLCVSRQKKQMRSTSNWFSFLFFRLLFVSLSLPRQSRPFKNNLDNETHEQSFDLQTRMT